MAKFARLTTDSLVIETHECESLTELGKHFYPTIAEQFVAVPDDAEPGDTITDGAYKPAPSPEPEAPPAQDKIVTRQEFLACFTRAQRVAMKARATNDDVDDMYDGLESTNHINIDDENVALFASLLSGGTIDHSCRRCDDALRSQEWDGDFQDQPAAVAAVAVPPLSVSSMSSGFTERPALTHGLSRPT